MRLLVVALGAAVLAAAPASAAEVDPKVLVLRQGDVPAGFRLDSRQTGLQSNDAISKGGAEHRLHVRRAGRVTGYVAFWDRRRTDDIRLLSSRADLCRGPSGARRWLEWLESRMRTANAQIGNAYAREPARLGSGGWVYHGTPRGLHGVSVTVGWRHGRAVALLATDGIPLREALALARMQQRRMAAGVR